MSLRQLIDMVIRMLTRSAVSVAIDKGAELITRRGGAPARGDTAAGRAQQKRARQLAKRARQAARLTRRMREAASSASR